MHFLGARTWLIALASLLVSMNSFAQHPPLGAGLDGIADYSHSRWFVDVMKFSRSFGQPTAPYNAYTGTFNATTHYPTQDFALWILMDADPTHEAFLGGTYKLSFTGQANVEAGSSSVTVTNAVYSSSTNMTTADVAYTLGGSELSLRFRSPVNMNNLRLISPGYSTTNPPLIRNEWVNILNQFNQFRFMDWLSTNGNPVVSWDDCHLVTLPGQVNRNNAGAGCAWEDVCAFSKQLKKDVWINIPAKANDDFVTKCATLLRDSLDPSVNVYVEFSNEVWNFSFGQFNDNLNAAKAEVNAGSSTLNNDGSTDQYSWASRRVVKRIYEISNIFKTVWGASAINSRVRCVVAGQLTYSHAPDLDWFNKTYGPPKNFFWAIANAPYWNVKPVDDNNTSATVAQLLTQLETNKNALFDNRVMDLAAATAAYFGLEFMGYEGGPDTFGPNNQQAKSDLNFDAKMKTLCSDFLTRWYQNGGRQFNWFVIGSAGTYVGQYGTWSLLGWMGDSTTNMKYQGVKQILTGATPAITAGLALPGTFKATQTVGYPSSFGANKMICMNPTEISSDNIYFCNSPAAGSYNFSVTTSGGTANTKASVYVNNVKAGDLTLSTSSGYVKSSVLPVALPQGLVSIRVFYTGVDRNLGCLYVQDVAVTGGITPTRDAPLHGLVRQGTGLSLSLSDVTLSVANTAGICLVRIIDFSGRVLINKRVNGEKQLSLPLRGLSAGSYVAEVVPVLGESFQRRFVK